MVNKQNKTREHGLNNKKAQHARLWLLSSYTYTIKSIFREYLADARNGPVLHCPIAIYTTRPSGQTAKKAQVSKAIPLLEQTTGTTQNI